MSIDFQCVNEKTENTKKESRKGKGEKKIYYRSLTELEVNHQRSDLAYNYRQTDCTSV